MIDNHYQNLKLAEIYDLDSGWSSDREFYLSLAGPQKQTILDLGCGTGLLCDAYAAKGHVVTGAEPAAAMLDVARRKPHGANIEWVQSFAQDFKSDRKFDLIIMTGHAFQVLLSDADIAATFVAMRNHLNEGGKIVFESRNPAIDWTGKWNYEIPLQTPSGPVIESRRFISLENGVMTFELRYQFPDDTLLSKSQLRFLSRQDIERLLMSSGLHAKQVLGDWDGRTFDECVSEEMIFFVRAS